MMHGVVVTSSPELSVEPTLALLDGKSTAHFDGIVGFMTCSGALFGETAKLNATLRLARDTPCEGQARMECCEKVVGGKTRHQELVAQKAIKNHVFFFF